MMSKVFSPRLEKTCLKFNAEVISRSGNGLRSPNIRKKGPFIVCLEEEDIFSECFGLLSKNKKREKGVDIMHFHCLICRIYPISSIRIQPPIRSSGVSTEFLVTLEGRAFSGLRRPSSSWAGMQRITIEGLDG